MSADQLVIGKGNEGQLEAWDGDEGEQWAAKPEFYDNANRRHHARLMEAARIESSDHVLDIACGNGQTTRDAARRASEGLALGVDLSSQMLDVARKIAAEEGLTNASFVQADAQVHPFELEAFDVTISRFGSMFIADQVAAFKNIARALRPAGRLAHISWQSVANNEWLTAIGEALTLGRAMQPPPPDAPSPFGHADPDRTQGFLSDAGFADIAIDGVEEPIYFGADAGQAYAVLSETMGWLMGDLEGADRAKALDNLRTSLEAHETPEGVAYRSAAWLITARRP